MGQDPEIGIGAARRAWPRFGGPAAVVAAVAIGVYANTFGHGFVVDDVHQIVQNDWVTGPRHLPEVFSSGVWDFEGRASSYYRPMMYVLYMLVHAIAGKAPWAYHVANVLLHAATSVLVLLLVRRILVRERCSEAASASAALVAALLFAVHPVHTEPVAWVAGAADLGFGLFGVLASWLWVGAKTTGTRSWAAGAALLVAMLFKEPAVVLGGVLLLDDVAQRSMPFRPGPFLRRYAPLGAAAAVYLVSRTLALGGLAPNAGASPIAAETWLLSAIALLAMDVSMLLVPSGLNFWHAFVPPASFASPEAIRAVIVLVVATAAGAYAARRSRSALTGVALLAAPLVPTLHLGALNQGLENAFTERYLYVPSVGLVLIAGAAYAAARNGVVGRGRTATVLAVAILAVFAAITVRRNPVWKDHLTLWADAAAKSPESAVARKNYGLALIHAGRAAEGRAAVRAAVAQRPELVDTEIAKGLAMAAKGLRKQALLALDTAVLLDPSRVDTRFRLASAYDDYGWADAAIGQYRAVLALRPDLPEAHNNLGILLAQRGLADEALEHFTAAVRLDPVDSEYRANLDRLRAGR